MLQGLQGVNLTQEQLVLIQQKVKTELLKQQAMARQQNRPPPTKVRIVVPVRSAAIVELKERVQQLAKTRDENFNSATVRKFWYGRSAD
jgi:hypothetical protein